MSGRLSALLIVVAGVICAGNAVAQGSGLQVYAIAGDEVPAPLGGLSGDPARGRTIVLDRQVGNCLICHRVPHEPAEQFQGDIGPSLASVGTRLSVAKLRFRLIDQSRLNQQTVMPPYYRIEGLHRVPARFHGRPVLDAQQIEDVVAYLALLKE